MVHGIDPGQIMARDPAILLPFTVLCLPEVPAELEGPGWRLTSSVEERPDAVVALTRPAALDLEAVIRRWQDHLMPVADLAGADLRWVDRSSAGGIDDFPAALQALLAVHRRLTGLPARVRYAERPDAVLLARLLTRQTDLEPRYDPGSPMLVGYPAAGLLAYPESVAERLAAVGLLSRDFFDRLHVCPTCASSRLNVREECRECRHPDLASHALVHHFRCAFQAPEPEFRKGDRLVCPKCGKELRHFGVDYDKPGAVSVCGRCGHADAEPAVGFLCMDCGAHSDAGHVSTRDWHRYALTAAGERAVLTGQIVEDWRPALDIPLDVLAILVRKAVRVEARYGRPFTLMVVTFGNWGRRGAPGDDPGSPRRLALDLVREHLRDTDVIAETTEGCAILMPETEPAAARVPLERLSAGLRALLPPGADLHVAIVSQGEAETAVEQLA